jgi:hypothetical protein
MRRARRFVKIVVPWQLSKTGFQIAVYIVIDVFARHG